MLNTKKIRNGFLVALTGLLLQSGAHAGLLSDRWAKIGDWDNAVAAAKKAEKPLAILYGFDNYAYTTVGQDDALNYFMQERSLEQCVRVFNSTADRVVKVRQFFPHADRASGSTPELYFVEPNRMRLIGFVDYTNFSQTPKVARSVMEIMKWLDKSSKEIERADKAADLGQFKAALKTLDKVCEDDAKVSKALEQHLGVPYDPNRKPAGEDAEPNKQASDEADSPKRENKADKDDAKPDEAGKSDKPGGKGTFYPGLMETKREAYDKLVAARLSTAKSELAKQQFVKAKAACQSIVTDNADLPSIAEARKLLDEIIAAEKAAKAK